MKTSINGEFRTCLGEKIRLSQYTIMKREDNLFFVEHCKGLNLFEKRPEKVVRVWYVITRNITSPKELCKKG